MDCSRHYSIIVHRMRRRSLCEIVEFGKNRNWNAFLVYLVLVTFHCEGFARSSLSVGKNRGMVALLTIKHKRKLHRQRL